MNLRGMNKIGKPGQIPFILNFKKHIVLNLFIMNEEKSSVPEQFVSGDSNFLKRIAVSVTSIQVNISL